MIQLADDCGKPAFVSANRGVHQSGTTVFIDVYLGDRLVVVLVATDDQVEAILDEMVRQLPEKRRKMLGEELPF